MRTHWYTFSHADTRVLFHNNKAHYKGGAIYVETEFGMPVCFFQLDHVWEYASSNIQLTFEGNHANLAGSAINGGCVNSCWIYEVQVTHFRRRMAGPPSVKVFEKIFNFMNSTSAPSLSLVSSDPIRVCFCNNATIDYAFSQIIQREAFPGQMFEVEAVAVGQQNGTTPGIIVSTITSNTTAQFEEVQKVQEGHVMCTQLQYSISPQREDDNLMIQLTPQGVSRDFYTTTFINFTLNTCPPDFELHHVYRTNHNLTMCDCDSQLALYNMTCDINNQSISIAGSVWINASFSTHLEYLGLIVHAHCPFDYCTTSHIAFKMDTPDAQCAFNRSAILCGACLPGYSVALGTSRCLKCSNITLLLLIPLCAAGLALVFILMVLNLTVSTGTINGLILYANIVRDNHAVYFLRGDKRIFTVFIA